MPLSDADSRSRKLHKAAVSGGRGNALLTGMGPIQRARLTPLLTEVTFASGDVLVDSEALQHVYFPLDCVISLVAPLKHHPPIEVALVGNEGVIGVPLVLGTQTSSVQAICQGSGGALSMKAPVFRQEMRDNSALQTGIYRYINALMAQLSQTAACNAFHPLEARCARWLLMSRDRMRSDRLELTQELIANMLGVRRVGVTVAAGNLQRQKLIDYSRGHITILDAARLRSRACECYALIKNLYRDVA